MGNDLMEITVYGTELEVKSPEILRDIDAPVVVLPPGPYSQEIISDILRINPTTLFLR